MEELYSDKNDNWFNRLLDDPNLSAIQFTPSEANYWDTKENPYFLVLKMGCRAITGKKVNVGEKDELNI